MTFSQNAKNEILQSVRNAKDCCATAFLTAVLKSVGSLVLGRGGYCFSVESDNVDMLTRLSAFAERLGVGSRIETYNMSAKGTAVYSCRFDAALGEKLGLVVRQDGMLTLSNASLLIPSSVCCRRAFMQGLFVSSGSVVVPENDGVDESDKAKYHLELRFGDADFAKAVSESYSEVGFRQTQRKNHSVLYLKESEAIADFLVYLNCTKAKLRLENIIVARSVRNAVNRQSNCTVANIEKTVVASQRQLESIRLLRGKGLFESLPPPLKEIALLREENPEASLDELANTLHISKSGVNHRFAKLAEIASK